MKTKRQNTAEVIAALVRAVMAYSHSHETTIVSASIVGSRSPQSREHPRRADIDLLVLVQDLRVVHSFDAWLSNCVGDGVTVVTGWGVVDAADATTEVVHCLLDPVDHYVTRRSRLFRRAVAKYQPFVGRCLREFAPEPVSVPELLMDWDGPARLASYLAEARFETRVWTMTGGTWELAVMPNRTASPLEHALYSALHSCRNVLRALRAYDERATVSELPELWRQKRLPAATALQHIADLKQSRRMGDATKSGDEQTAYATCLEFLHEVVHHVSQAT